MQIRRTARLTMRRPEGDDEEALLRLHTDLTTNSHRPGGPPAEAEVREMLARLMEEWCAGDLSYWTVLHRGSIIGMAGVRPLAFEGAASWNLYYRFFAEHWGAGFALEAAEEAVRAAAEIDPSRPVVARTRPTNAAAIRVAERAGLTRCDTGTADGYVLLVKGFDRRVCPEFR